MFSIQAHYRSDRLQVTWKAEHEVAVSET